MKAIKTGMLTLALLGMVTTACSSISSAENKLVGEWQSPSGQKFVRLKITKARTDNEGFHDGCSFTYQNGETSTFDWRVNDPGDGLYLILKGKGAWDNLVRQGGIKLPTLNLKIVDLTSDKLVIVRSGNREEFHRVK